MVPCSMPALFCTPPQTGSMPAPICTAPEVWLLEQVLDPMQHARIMLASFPYAPNMAALCALLLQQHPNHQQPQPGLQLQAPEQYPAAAEDGSPGGKISPHRQANGYGTQCPLPDGLGRHPLGMTTFRFWGYPEP